MIYIYNCSGNSCSYYSYIKNLNIDVKLCYLRPLATYNSLTDTHLAGFFANTRKRRHLVKSGLVSGADHCMHHASSNPETKCSVTPFV